MKKIYYLYQIQNLINGKIYVGVHETYNIEDGYMGSGVKLKQAQKEEGIKNFQKTILKFFDNSEDMFAEEAEVVNSPFLLREDVYNVCSGGHGAGFSKEAQLYSNERKAYLREHDVAWATLEAEKLRLMWELSHSEESSKRRQATMKLRGHSKGEKNPQFGKIWVTDGTNNRFVKKDSIPEGFCRGRTVPKIAKIWITNGVTNKLIVDNGLVPEGFWKGMVHHGK
jgi:hypothetical protein